MCLDNVNYIVIAVFIVLSESANDIADALKVVKQWNPKWNPPYFMKRNIWLLLKSFLYALFVFHREQVWERWVRDHCHNLNIDKGDNLLHLL